MTSILYNKHFDNYTILVCVPLPGASIKHTSVCSIEINDCNEANKTRGKYESLFHCKEVTNELIGLLKKKGFKTKETQSSTHSNNNKSNQE